MRKSSRPILLTGGGTLGSVTPLLGVYETWKEQDPDQSFLWVGTKMGPERRLVEDAGIPFFTTTSPKAYRYLTWRWILTPFQFALSVWTAVSLLWNYRPSWVISAGAYTGVTLGWLAPLFGARVALYQSDYEVGLANRVVFPMASVITTTFAETAKQIGRHAECVGALVAHRRLWGGTRDQAEEVFGLVPGRQTVLVLGGGTGAVGLNDVFESLAESLTRTFNVLHATGAGKRVFSGRRPPDGYYATELFVDDFGFALQVADVVVTRAGLGTLIELVEKKKATILVPLPNSPQVANARVVEEAGAAVVCPQEALASRLMPLLQEVLEPHKKRALQEAIGNLFPLDGAKRFVELLRT